MYDRKGKKAKDLATDRLYEVIHVLSDVNRMQILALLAEQGELCARDILAHFPITQPTLSHHMNILLENHLVEARKSGRWVFYRLSGDGLQGVIDFFESLKSSTGVSSGRIQMKPLAASTKRPTTPKVLKKLEIKVVEDTPVAVPFVVDVPKKEKKKEKGKDKLNKKDKKKKKNKKN